MAHDWDRQVAEQITEPSKLDTAEVRTLEDLARLLRALRRRHARNTRDSELTYRELAAKTGWSATAIAEYFTARTLPPTDRFDALIELLGATATEQGTLATARDQVAEHRRAERAAPGSLPPRQGSGAGVVPRQLPARPRLFTGRANELAQLTAMLDAHEEPDGTVVSVIGGVGGIGKTWLALHWAHRHLDRFPDGQLYVDLRGFDPTGHPMSAASAVRGLLDALGVEPAAIPPDAQAQTGLYRSLTADMRMLIVLDNAADTAHVASLLPGSPTCTVLITSRRRLTGLVTAHGARTLELGVLTDAQAREVLARHLGEERLAAQPREAAELLGYCAGLPLAISIVAARANTHPDFPLSVLAAELRDQPGRLDALEDNERHTNLRAPLSWSYQALTNDAAAVFRLLGVAPGPDISRTATAALTALPATKLSIVLRELENMHLLYQDAPGRYRMHDLVRLYAADCADNGFPAADRLAALRRLVAFYLGTALAGDTLLDPHRPSIQITDVVGGHCPDSPDSAVSALDWFTAEHATLQAVQLLAAEQGWNAEVWQLAWAMDTFHWRRGLLLDALAAWQTALEASDELGEPVAQVLTRRRLGHACALVGLHAQASVRLHEALSLARHVGDVAAQAHIHHSLAWAYEQRGEDRPALEHANRALKLYQLLDMPVWEARELNAVGWYHTRLGEHAQARIDCEAALALFRRHANRAGEANTLDSLGYIEHHVGQFTRARDYYRQALEALNDLGHAYQQANTFDQLGRTHTALAEHEEARTAWQRALALYQAQGRSIDADRVRQHLENR